MPNLKVGAHFLNCRARVNEIQWVYIYLLGTVIHQCGLARDLSLFDARDYAEIGEKGLTLSGGQKVSWRHIIDGTKFIHCKNRLG